MLNKRLYLLTNTITSFFQPLSQALIPSSESSYRLISPKKKAKQKHQNHYLSRLKIPSLQV